MPFPGDLAANNTWLFDKIFARKFSIPESIDAMTAFVAVSSGSCTFGWRTLRVPGKLAKDSGKGRDVEYRGIVCGETCARQFAK